MYSYLVAYKANVNTLLPESNNICKTEDVVDSVIITDSRHLNINQLKMMAEHHLIEHKVYYSINSFKLLALTKAEEEDNGLWKEIIS